MEGITRLVTESLARHGFDRPLDYRRLAWSLWFRCESPHSLMIVPSKPGVFAIAEEIMDFANVGTAHVAGNARVETGASPVPRSEASGPIWNIAPEAESRTPGASSPRRMLAVTQFYEDTDMAYVLDRMLARENPMRARLASGRYFIRFVIVEDQTQRRSICSALNQWIVSASEKASGIGAHFATSLELTPNTEFIPQAHEDQGNLFETNDTKSVATKSVSRAPSPATADTITAQLADQEPSGLRKPTAPTITASLLDSGAGTNIHCPSPFPSGF